MQSEIINKNILLDVAGIELSYGESGVINSLSVSINPGSFIGLVGPNGAGKTTLMLSLSGQFKPQKGIICYKDQDIYAHNLAYKYHIGYVHENPFFYDYLTAKEYLVFIARVKMKNNLDIESELERVLAFVNLVGDVRSALISTFSYGMRQKLAIAGAFLCQPEILFLDEALNGVDIESAYGIKEGLKQFVARGGTVILSTHTLDTLEKVSDRLLILKNGQLMSDIDVAANKNISLEQHIMKLLKEVK